MRIVIPLLLLLSAACAGSQPAPGTPAAARATLPVMGIWRVTQVNGRDLPTEAPTERGVTIERASLMLQARGRYTLSMTARTATATGERNQSGRYSARDGTLTLAAETGGATRFTYTLADGVLTLRDAQGNVYTLART